MMQILSFFFGTFYMAGATVYMIVKNGEIKTNYIKSMIAVLILASVMIINNILNNTLLKPFLIIISIVLIHKCVFKLETRKSIVSAFYIEFICIIYEVLYGIILLLINNEINLALFNSSELGVIVSNVAVSILMMIFVSTKLSHKIFDKIYGITDYLNDYYLEFIIFIIFAIVVILFQSAYYTYYSNQVVMYITITIIFFLYTTILIGLINSTNKYKRIRSKYFISLENITEYEAMLNQYRVSTHENKNQLLMIRNMGCSEETKKYIDQLIDNKTKDDSNIYNVLKRVPSTTIRAVLYSKILLMTNKGIKYSITVDRKIGAKDMIELSDNLVLAICNILNVFIDNAIEEVSNVSPKQVLIEFHKVLDEIEISISNICRPEIDIKKISTNGYSTKGKNRGYGLGLVKSTLYEHNGSLRNMTEIKDDIFTQYLYVKVK